MVAPEEVASVYVLASYLEGEANWYLTHLTGGSDSGSRANIRRNYGRLCQACLVVSHYIPSSVAYLLSLVIREVHERGIHPGSAGRCLRFDIVI